MRDVLHCLTDGGVGPCTFSGPEKEEFIRMLVNRVWRLDRPGHIEDEIDPGAVLGADGQVIVSCWGVWVEEEWLRFLQR